MTGGSVAGNARGEAPRTARDELAQGMAEGPADGSVARVRAALLAAGHPDTIRAFPDGTRSAADAAAAVGCEVAQIAKSIVFRAGDRPVVVIAGGANRVDMARVAALTGLEIAPAQGRWVREATGFAIGGVSPLCHAEGTVMLLDEDLFAWERVWAAAGSPRHVFETTPGALLRLTGAMRGAVREEAPPA